MVDVNLLPEELRKKEEEEKKAAKKRPNVFEMKLTDIADDSARGKSGGKRGRAGVLPTPEKSPLDDYRFNDENGDSKKAEEARKGEAPFGAATDVQKVKIDKSGIHTLQEEGKPYMRERKEDQPEKEDAGKAARHEKKKDGVVSDKVEKEAREAQEMRRREMDREDVAKTPKESVVITEVQLPKRKRKKKGGGFFSWLFSLFSRKKKGSEKEHKILLENTIQTPPEFAEKHEKQQESPKKEEAVEKEVKVAFPPERSLPREKKKKKGFFAMLFGGRKRKEKSDAKKGGESPAKAGKKPLAVPELISKKAGGEAGGFQQKGDRRGKRIDEGVERPVQTLDINLIPTDSITHPELNIRPKLIGLIVVFVLSSAIVGAAYGVVRYYEGRIGTEITFAQSEIEKMRSDIEAFSAIRTKAVDLKERLDFVEMLLNRHIYWTIVFEELEKHTIDDVYFMNFAADRDGRVVLSAVGVDYRSVARQIVAFEEANSFVVDVTVDSASMSFGSEDMDSQVRFDVNLLLAPRVFYKNF